MDVALTFAHLSDPHLTSPAGASLRDLVGKRALGYLSWRLRRHRRHRAEILGALVRDLDHGEGGQPVTLAHIRLWLELRG
jgi:hypothetical protein